MSVHQTLDACSPLLLRVKELEDQQGAMLFAMLVLNLPGDAGNLEPRIAAYVRASRF
jgi:hypothetical protein